MKIWCITILKIAFMATSCSVFQSTSKKNISAVEVVAGKADSIPRNKLKLYSEIIPKDAQTQNGLIKVHKAKDRFYFEIPDSLLNKDILVVNRISKGSASELLIQGMLGYAGDYIGESVIQFSKGPDQRMFIRRISVRWVSTDSSDNGMFRSILNTNIQPIVASFPIKTFSADSTASVIDVHDYLNGDNDVFFFSSTIKRMAGLGGLQTDKSYIQKISSFPTNTEIRTVKTYALQDKMLTYELNSSMVLLPSEEMRSRLYDERVGYFSRGYLNYDASEGVKPNIMITRWRLEPKKEDIEKYLSGTLVEPQKPIVFYIDPATPKKWIPYLIKGVNHWQKAFEKAGFKNAIYALEAPSDDSSWSIEDARHNVIVYKASPVQNASGPQISDPRSGEILESHINWYHNVQKLLRDWYFIQASPSDPRARKMNFDDELMGELISFVCTHEVGHTLGLQHNFAASAAIPVDSLRSRSYLSQHSHTASVMDYARFNYVAQPEDKIDPEDLIPKISTYDEWAIEWGYRWFPAFQSDDEEKTFMNKWIIRKLKENPHCFYTPQKYPDIRNQMEDLGDDPVKASTLGIKNLKFVMSNLKMWTSTPNDDYSDTRRMYETIWNTYSLYLSHVNNLVQRQYWTPLTVEQGDQFFAYADRNKFLSAIAFFDEQLFKTPDWLSPKVFFNLGAGGGNVQLYKVQEWIVHNLVNASIWNMLLYNQAMQPAERSFSFDELISELETRIFSELKSGKPIEMPRRNLQKIYVRELINTLRYAKSGDMGEMDLCTDLLTYINRIHKRIKSSMLICADKASKTHLADLATRLNQALEYQKNHFPETFTPVNIPANTENSFWPGTISNPFLNTVKEHSSCWNLCPVGIPKF